VNISTFDLFSIGIGPSSSHTVGPMRAARMFVESLHSTGQLEVVARVKAELFGSLGATGKGHGSPKAVVLGLLGESPENVDVETALARYNEVKQAEQLCLAGEHNIAFSRSKDLILHFRKSLEQHSNGMIFSAFDVAGEPLAKKTYYSVGGGFVLTEGGDEVVPDKVMLAYPFSTAEELLKQCEANQCSISDLMLQNEQAWRSEAGVRDGLMEIWSVMQGCVSRGLNGLGHLIRVGGKRRKCGGWSCCDGSHQWCRGYYSCGIALLLTIYSRCE